MFYVFIRSAYVRLSDAFLHPSFFFHTETKSHWYDSVSAAVLIGVKVPITSSVYGYTKALAHNLNSKKTSGAAIG